MAIDGKKLLTLVLLGLGGYIAYQYYVQSQLAGTVTDSETDPTDSALNTGIVGPLQTLWENAVNTISPGAWMTAGEGPTYQPTFAVVESNNGIPTNLLYRIGYQESHFRSDIIDGSTVSPAGAVGIMQLMPQFFPGAGQDPQADIATAGAYLAKLYGEFNDWQLATAAYNDGPGNINAYIAGTKQLPLETQNYVADVFADVPVQGSLIQVA
jgi:soluble lytic murein transglycosylase-like protein